MPPYKFPFYAQRDHMDCGPTCLRIISKHYGHRISLNRIKQISETTREGSTLKNIADAAENMGFRSLGVKINYEKLKKEAPLPCIVFWQQRHFIVVYRIKKNLVYVSDPAHGLLKYKTEEFISSWISPKANEKTKEGIVLLLDPTPRLTKFKDELANEDRELAKGLNFIFQYLFRYKKFFTQLIIGFLAGSILQLIFPFLTQSIVDIGVRNRDLNFVYIILIAQLFLFFGNSSIEIVRGWILLHLGTRINISLVSDFFIKLMNLPIGFFDTKMTGDIMQRIHDHRRIEKLLTTTSLNVMFSFFTLIVFTGVLAWYDYRIFLIFFVGSTIYFLWILLFLNSRKKLDYKRFSQLGEEQSKVIELINGMQEIKLHNAERQKRWGWEFLQAKLFKISIKNLILEQIQGVGTNFINEIKNILITVFSAKLVIEGQMTLGMMLSVSYIIGQLNGPIYTFIEFVYTIQDAKIAIERLSEIHNRPNEETFGQEKISNLSNFSDITIKDLHYRYSGSSEEIIKGIDFIIPKNKITAIVGASGSGKTTLMKILLKFYEPTQGEIHFGDNNLFNISQKAWRNYTGVVMQEGYIFNDTIVNNIVVGEPNVNFKKLSKSIEVANISEFIKNLPLGFNTKIGMDGVGISTGQKQRLLIARAVYKDPKIIFFDEATSALDAKNERIIMNNLNIFFKDRTAVVIAHRLSTVKNADQIIVIEDGKIIEKGSHIELIELEGSYYSLVKNQLQIEKLNA